MPTKSSAIAGAAHASASRENTSTTTSRCRSGAWAIRPFTQPRRVRGGGWTNVLEVRGGRRVAQQHVLTARLDERRRRVGSRGALEGAPDRLRLLLARDEEDHALPGVQRRQRQRDPRHQRRHPWLLHTCDVAVADSELRVLREERRAM